MVGAPNKEDLRIPAREVFCGVRRSASVSQLGTSPDLQVLLSASEALHASCQSHAIVDLGTVDVWATSFGRELISQLNWCGCSTAAETDYGGGGFCSESHESELLRRLAVVSPSIWRSERKRCRNESTMIGCSKLMEELLEASGEDVAKVFSRRSLVLYMVSFFVHVPLTTKVLCVFPLALVRVIGYNATLLREGISACRLFLAPRVDECGACSITTQQVRLVGVLAAAIRWAGFTGDREGGLGLGCSADLFLSELIDHCSLLMGDTGGGACVAYFDLLKVAVRSCAETKALCHGKYREKFMALWVKAASNIHSVRPKEGRTNGESCETADFVGSEEALILVLLDLLVDVSTTSSFSSKREIFLESPGCSVIGSDGLEPRSPLPTTAFLSLTLSMSHLTYGGTGCRAFESSLASWEAMMTGAGEETWKLAALLSECALTGEGCSLVAEALLRINTERGGADCVYRYIIFTLALLCTAGPQNAKVLAGGPVIDALLARIASHERSVFYNTDSTSSVVGSPPHPLDDRSTRVSIALLNLLSSLYTNERVMKKLMDGVGKMCVRRTVAVDVETVESFLDVIGRASLPRGALYFSGNSAIFCSSERSSFPSLFDAYCCALWVLPKCVWLEGSPLFRCEHVGANVSVTLVIVANGRRCRLVLRLDAFTEVTDISLSDTLFQADAWTHIIVMQHTTGFTIYVNGRKAEVPLPLNVRLAVSREEVRKFSLGGVRGALSFFGFAASVELLDRLLTEEEVQEAYRSGPRSLGEVLPSRSPPFGASCGTVSGVSFVNIEVASGFDRRPQNLLVINVSAFLPPDMEEIFACHDVAGWALRTMVEASVTTESFPVVVGLCMRFLCTAMKLSARCKGIDQILDVGVIERLRRALLSWRRIPADVPALLMSCCVPRDGKIMRDHSTTQNILSLMLSLVHEGGLGSHDVSCLLRELSDVLLFPENVAIFRLVPGRFEGLLKMSVSLPIECVGSLIVLVERLCKESREIEHVLKFLLTEAVSETHECVKVAVLHMLFDVARTNATVCDLIRSAFGNTGPSFLILLVGGRNHGSEVIRILALRILTLLFHAAEGFHMDFIRGNGYEILAEVMTGPDAACVPVGMATFNCLFQMAFDVVRPALGDGPGESGRKEDATPRQQPRNVPSGTSVTQAVEKSFRTVGSQGYMPCPLHRPPRHTRREYRFEPFYESPDGDGSWFLLNTDYGVASTRMGEDCVPREPRVIYLFLRLLTRVLQNIKRLADKPLECASLTTTVPRDHILEGRLSGNDRYVTSCVDVDPLRIPRAVAEPPEVVASRVITYIEKIADSSKGAKLLLPFPWLLTQLWDIAQCVIGDPSLLSNRTSDFVSSNASEAVFLTIEKRVRRIITRLAILDISCNPRAHVVPAIVQGMCTAAVKRITLGDIASYFSTSHNGFESRAEAMCVLRNLDMLFKGTWDLLSSSPVSLVLGVVNCISAIAVKNNSWVRMRIKDSSCLFNTRDRLGLLVLTTAANFSEFKAVTLRQILEVNASEPRVMPILLSRLASAVVDGDVGEVKTLILMIWHLIEADDGNFVVLQSIVGAEHAYFIDEVCMHRGSVVSATHMSAEGVPMAFCVEREVPIKSDDAVTSGAYTAAVSLIEWCRADCARWRVVEQRLMNGTEHGSREGECSGNEGCPDSGGVEDNVAKYDKNLREDVMGSIRRIKSDVDMHFVDIHF